MKKRRRESKGKKQHDEGTWAISYGDMITLLLGFFILFFSMEPNKKGNAVLTDSLIETMRKLDDNIVVSMDSAAGEDQRSQQVGSEEMKDKKAVSYGETKELDGSFIRDDRDDEDVNLGSDEGKYAGDGTDTEDYSQGLFDALWAVFFGDSQTPYKKQEQIADVDKPSGSGSDVSLSAKAPVTKKDEKDYQKFGIDPSSKKSEEGKSLRGNIVELKALEAEAEQIGDKIVIRFPNISFFNTASTALTEEGEKAIKKFGNIYLPFAGSSKLNIIGYTDDRPVKSGRRFRDNLELSVLRAVSVQRNLENLGIPRNHTRLAGYGVKETLLPEETPKSKTEQLALSRKVVLVIEPSGE